MKAQIPRRYRLIPVLYLLLIGGLLVLEFSGTTKIEERLHNVSLKAVVAAKTTGNGSLQQLRVDMDGLIFSFDTKNPLEIKPSSGGFRYAKLSGYAVSQGSVDVVFGDELTLRFHAGGGSQNRIEIDADVKEKAELTVPFSYAKQAEVDVSRGLPLLALYPGDRQGDTLTVVALPALSIIDQENGTLTLRNDGDSFEDIYVSRLDTDDTAPFAYWFSLHHQDQSPERLDSVREDYLDTSFRGWTQTRYSSAGGTWRMQDSTTEFDERTLTAALTEALRRGSFLDTYNRFRTGLRLHADKLSYMSAPHVGDIFTKADDISAGDLNRIRQVETLVSEENTSVFAIPKLLSFTRDRAPTPLFQDIADLAARIDPVSVGPNDVSGMLNVYLESRSLEDPLGGAFEGFREAVDRCLLPAIHLTDRGYFIAAPGGQIDIETCVHAGIALERLGSFEDNETYGVIGRALMSSALLLSESEGFLPARLTIDGWKVVDSDGALNPEQIYPLIAGDRYYPKYVSLGPELGNGAWVWSSAENFKAERDGSVVRLTFEYPIGATHHFILRGIKPFSFMTFFGIRWVSDPQFQMYGSGWLYDAAEETLYVKITHTRVREELVITY